MNNKKIRVAVLFGGRSPEHEVSVSSAANVIAALDRSLFDVVPIKIDKQGTWLLQNNEKPALPNKTEDQTAPELFNPNWIKEPETRSKKELLEFCSNQKNKRLFDVIFPIMHGSFSEDGTIQGLLELADIPYVGCGVLASAIGMDKDVARRLVSHGGMQTVIYLALKRDEWKRQGEKLQKTIKDKFTLPLFVKPANQGSSIGVTKVKAWDDLTKAIDFAFHYDTKILVEQGISALTELEVSVLEAPEAGESAFVSLVGEVRPNDEFYSYSAKYTEGGADFIIPAEISKDVEESVSALARDVFNVLGAEGMARVDFFLDKNTQKLYFNEMNSIPGFTPFSMTPQQVVASGMSYSDLLTRLVRVAIKRFEERQGLERNYLA